MASWSWDRIGFRVGRVNCFIWAPVRFSHEQDGDWHYIGVNFPWSRPRNWRFPEDAQASHCPTIVRGLAFGPFDIRVMREDKHG